MTGEDGRHVVAIVQAIYQSNRESSQSNLPSSHKAHPGLASSSGL